MALSVVMCSEIGTICIDEVPSFSVAISVYHKDNAEWFDIALSSIVHQSMQPNEIVLVVDGPVSDDIQSVIRKYEIVCQSKKILYNVVYQDVNKGLGKCLNIAVQKARNEIIARMDSDDIASYQRFEKEVRSFMEDPELSIVGSYITEFIGDPSNIVAKRECPTESSAIYKYMKTRCGFNHMTVMFKRKDVLRVGNYQHWHYNEDYYLWIRMALAGCKMKNLGEYLVNVRVGKDMYRRRGGWQYFQSEFNLQRYMLANHFIGYVKFIYNTACRFIIEVALPNSFREFIFKRFLRKH